MEDYGIEEARKHLGDIVNRAYFTGEATRITRHGVPVAVVVSAKLIDQMLALVHDTDGNWLPGSSVLPVGEFQATLSGLAPEDRETST